MTQVRHDSRAEHIVRLVEQRMGPGMLDDASSAFGEDVLHASRERVLVLLQLLRDDPDADMRLLVDITAIDHGATQTDRPRFEVVYRLRSPRLGYRALIIVPVDGGDAVVPSATGLYPAAAWLERELWEMFGVYPDGHPYLRPLLLYTGFAGHPQRRDYPLHKGQPLVPIRSDLAKTSVVADEAGAD